MADYVIILVQVQLLALLTADYNMIYIMIYFP